MATQNSDQISPPDDASAAPLERPVRGKPFQPGPDPRRGHGPEKGAPNAGRPPDEFKRLMASLASREETIHALEQILADPSSPHYIQALKFAADRGYGVPTQPVELETRHFVIEAPPMCETAEEWRRLYGQPIERTLP